MAPLTELSLFSGAGGGLLGTTHLLGWRTVCYVEWDKYAVAVLKARIRDGYLHDAPIWDDAFTFDGRPWAGLVDVVTAGFPCQPFSVAGKGLAEHDPRNGWPAVIRILREVRPRYALLENVPGLLGKPYIRRIYGDLAEAGFDVEQDCISAAEVGANHKRERLWLMAHAESEGKRRMAMERKQDRKDIDACRKGPHVADAALSTDEQSVARSVIWAMANSNAKSDGYFSNASGAGLSVAEQEWEARGSTPECGWWAVEPGLGRVADGVAHRVDRLRAIGNGQVPAVVREAWRRLGDK